MLTDDCQAETNAHGKNWNWKCNNDTKKIDSRQIHLNRWPGDVKYNK